MPKEPKQIDISRIPGGHTWSPTGEGATRIGDLYPTFWLIWKILQHLKLSADPPLIAPARVRQAVFAWSSA